MKITRWAGPKTFRVDTERGLWFGANLNTWHWFIIYNGKQHSWQVNNYNARLAYWGIYQKPLVLQGDLGKLSCAIMIILMFWMMFR